MFPHYFSNLLSVLLLNEMTRIIERNKLEEYIITNYTLKTAMKKDIMIFENDIETFFDCELSEDEISFLIKKEIIFENTYYFYSRKKYKIYKVLSFLCNFYWCLILLLLCFIITSYQISIIMLLYMSCLCISFLMIFKDFKKYLQKESSLFYSNIFF